MAEIVDSAQAEKQLQSIGKKGLPLRMAFFVEKKTLPVSEQAIRKSDWC